MDISVQPRDGPQLDRLITALLNATGVVQRVIHTIEHPPEADGERVIGQAAARLRVGLAILAERRSDEELALATEVLAEMTLLSANHLRLGNCFAED